MMIGRGDVRLYVTRCILNFTSLSEGVGTRGILCLLSCGEVLPSS
jgi:hypothetical protein